MKTSRLLSPQTIASDSTSGLIVFLVALPLCLGIAYASNAPPFAGLIAGIVGGIVVGALSGSHTSVSGPAAGLTAIVIDQIATLGSLNVFLLAVVLSGVIQIGLGIARAGALSAFFPSSVIKGLLAAIGVILILKQIPHLFGHDSDPVGEASFVQPDKQTTFSEIGKLFDGEIHVGAMVVGFAALALLILWDRFKPLKNSLVPAPLIAVLLGVGLAGFFETLDKPWSIGAGHRVQVPVADNLTEFVGFLQFPDWSQILNPAVFIAAITLAIVASLETLLNLEAVDKMDPQQRHSPPSRELVAQGTGNVIAGMIGGLPMTSVIIRGTVNVNAGAKTKLSAIFHGILLLVCVMLLPKWINLIPLSALAAILLVTGFKLASPKLFRQMYSEGKYQFLPFVITLLAIVRTDLLTGILIGLGVSVIFILASNLRRPIRRTVEKHVGGEVLHIELANQVSFLNRAAIERALREAPEGSHILLDARRTDYIDPDVRGLIRNYRDFVAPARGVRISLRGFRDKYELDDDIQFVDYTTRELQQQLTPAKVLNILKEGNERFRSGHSIDRDLTKQFREEIVNQHPMAVLISGIHSRIPAELIFDLGLGDILTVRLGGNIITPWVVGCAEYGCAVAGAKLVVVMGHTGSAMVTSAVNHLCQFDDRNFVKECPHLQPIIDSICESIDPAVCDALRNASPKEKAELIDNLARRNVQHSVGRLIDTSDVLRDMASAGDVAVVGAFYDVATGEIDFLVDDSVGVSHHEVQQAEEALWPS